MENKHKYMYQAIVFQRKYEGMCGCILGFYQPSCGVKQNIECIFEYCLFNVMKMQIKQTDYIAKLKIAILSNSAIKDIERMNNLIGISNLLKKKTRLNQ